MDNMIGSILSFIITCIIIIVAGYTIIRLIHLAKLLIENIYFTIKFQRLSPEERKKAKKQRENESRNRPNGLSSDSGSSPSDSGGGWFSFSSDSSDSGGDSDGGGGGD